MCEEGGALILDEDQNHVFQKHIVLIFGAMVDLYLGPQFSLKGLSLWLRH